MLPHARVLDAGVQALAPGMMAAGPAFAVRCRPGDNLGLHLEISEAQPGQMLVVDYGGSHDSGPFGEILAVAGQVRGVAGLAVDGAVRDGAQIAALGFPVFARGLNIRGTAKDDLDEIGGAVQLGGVKVRAGEIVIADADAVLIFSAEVLTRAVEDVEASGAKEA